MKVKTLILSLIITINALYAKDVVSDIETAIKTGSSSALSTYFADNISLKVLDKEDTYSKSQAELILKDFFAKHPIKSFALSHESITKGDSQYALGILITTTGKYRIYYLLKKTGNKQQIQQFRIETENE